MRKLAQTELDDVTAKSESLQSQNTELTFAKQKLEKEINTLKIDFEDAEERATVAEEKSKRIFTEVRILEGLGLIGFHSFGNQLLLQIHFPL